MSPRTWHFAQGGAWVFPQGLGSGRNGGNRCVGHHLASRRATLLATAAVAAGASVVAAMASAPPATPGLLDMGLVRAAMALRVKYRISGERKLISLGRLGVHPMNRGGVYPQPDTVRNLGLDLLNTGFNENEANHEGVCVEEVPFNERSAATADGSAAVAAPYESYVDFNRKNTDHPFLSACFSDQSDVMYGTLSHSHLLLVLLNFANGGHWKVEEDLRKMLRPDGSFLPAAVAASDGELEKLLKDGLKMEVLSWKIREEPTACSLISQALNAAQGMALRTSELTAMAVLSGAVALQLESAVAGEVAFESVKEKVRGELHMYVDMPGFIDLFEFVVNMGAGKNTFIQQLLDFGSKFVDPKQRQMSLAAFAEVNKLPLTVPRVKLGLIMRAYRKPPHRCWCPTPEAAWATREANSLQQLEAVLHFLHNTCKPAVAGMPTLELAVILANAHCAATEAYITCKDPRQEKNVILKAVAKYFEKIQTFAKDQGLTVPAPLEPWIDFSNCKTTDAVVPASAPPRLLPKLIEYDEVTGAPINQQDVKATKAKQVHRVIIPWTEWLTGAVAKTMDDEQSHMAAIQLVLKSLHVRGGVETASIDVSIDVGSNRRLVTASADLAPGSLVLPPCVPKTARAYKTSVHPQRVAIVVTEKSAVAAPQPNMRATSKKAAVTASPEITYYLHPEYKLPEESKEEVADDASLEVVPWEWKGDETMHPFWAVPRLSQEELNRANLEATPQSRRKFNVTLEEKEYSVVTVGESAGNSVSTTFAVRVPIMTNKNTIKKGEELVFQIAAKASGKRKAESWRDDVACTAKAKAKEKTRPKQAPASASLEIEAEI